MDRTGWKLGLRLPDELWDRIVQVKESSRGRYAKYSEVHREAVALGLQKLEANQKQAQRKRSLHSRDLETDEPPRSNSNED